MLFVTMECVYVCRIMKAILTSLAVWNVLFMTIAPKIGCVCATDVKIRVLELVVLALCAT